jgi:hypothetical protein
MPSRVVQKPLNYRGEPGGAATEAPNDGTWEYCMSCRTAEETSVARIVAVTVATSSRERLCKVIGPSE